jgi:pimeloyl-ACP methyl ester carboxylesterase
MATDASAIASSSSSSSSVIPLVSHHAELPGVRLHYVEAGTGPLVILLHGFPELWYAWRRQIAPLAQAGYRVIAPDMRGYNLSGKPHGISAYGARTLVDDIANLLRACGEERAHIVGHDWGGGVAWAFAMTHPEKTLSLAVLNSPHPERLIAAMKSPQQLLKSWYMFFFQIPRLPEAISSRDGHARWLKTLRDEPLVEHAFSPHDLAVYAESFAQPGATTAMINYYRAMFRPSLAPKLTRVDPRTLVIWGEQDPHLGRDLARPSPDRVPNARVEYLSDAGHWVLHERPEKVNALLVDHFSRA